tara:strand:- start:2288 stop:3202 length:915 start_codon:yes stop_codon:yes gene_type:complete
MMNNDEQLIFEAYMQKIDEAPIAPGDSYDEPFEPTSIDKAQRKKLAKYSKETIDDDSLEAIIDKVTEFLNSHENKTFPGDEDEFRVKIRDLIVDAGKESETLKINSTNAFYASRVIKNELKRLNIIQIVPGQDVEVQDVHDADVDASVEKGVQAAVKRGPAKTAAEIASDDEYNRFFGTKHKISFAQNYVLDDEVEVEGELKQAVILITTDLRGEFTGKELIVALRDEYKYDKAKDISDQLLDAGVIKVAETDEEDDEEGNKKVGDLDLDDSEEDYRSAVDTAYGDLRRDISSGQSPVMRPDDF